MVHVWWFSPGSCHGDPHCVGFMGVVSGKVIMIGWLNFPISPLVLFVLIVTYLLTHGFTTSCAEILAKPLTTASCWSIYCESASYGYTCTCKWFKIACTRTLRLRCSKGVAMLSLWAIGEEVCVKIFILKSLQVHCFLFVFLLCIMWVCRAA